MKIISAAQTRELDQYTINNEPISSLDLMERASLCLVDWYKQNFSDPDQTIHVLCGPGNNGGDGLAIARLLYQRMYPVRIYLCRIGNQVSTDFKNNLERLPPRSDIPLIELKENDALPKLEKGGLIIDAIFGSGLNRPVTGYWATLIECLNSMNMPIVSVDIPSGLFSDRPTTGVAIQADFTFSFELPKLAFLFPQNQAYTGHWIFRSIGLSQTFLAQLVTPFYYLDIGLIRPILHQRGKYDHKGTYGHALIIAGSYGKVGAAILATKACLRAGVGLVSIHAPKCAYEILQISVPEAMVSIDQHQFFLSEVPSLDPYSSIGIGCGIDQGLPVVNAFFKILEAAKAPMVLDADALNILGKHPEKLSLIPKDSILTPHPKEFERLFGKSEDDFSRNELQRNQSKKLGVFIVLKGAHTCISTPNGRCYFNSTGNPGMATAGSGDVLTGIISALLAQSYSALEAALLGVYIHGLAGDHAAEVSEQESLIASDIVDQLGAAFRDLKSDLTNQKTGMKWKK
ncbi:MAG: bifunctional NAD(P)H-hydrate repair enzyme [Saprospiraceae bacterium]|nr:MAG: bifunctional NAD(P)H-hydrate repair enzyme [Saprospiraceae bacterium]